MPGEFHGQRSLVNLLISFCLCWVFATTRAFSVVMVHEPLVVQWPLYLWSRLQGWQASVVIACGPSSCDVWAQASQTLTGERHPGLTHPLLSVLPSRGPARGARDGAGRLAGLIPPRAAFCRSRSPTVPWGQIHHATRSGLLRGRVKWPAAAGRWEPLTAIFNL